MKPVVKSYILVLCVLILTIGPMSYGNIVVKQGGLMDDALLCRSGPYHVFVEIFPLVLITLLALILWCLL
jgi:hypothetical protein